MTASGVGAIACLTLFVGVVDSGPTRAHGSIPLTESLAFDDDGVLLIGTNFGAVLVSRDGSERFICETSVTGTQQSITTWLWLASGAVAGISDRTDAPRGVFVSGPDGCDFALADGTSDLRMTDLVRDARDPSAFFATGLDGGVDDGRAVLVHGRPGETITRVYATDVAAEPSGVRAAGDHVYAVFGAAHVATVLHVSGEVVTSVAMPLAEGATLRPIGVAPDASLWLARSTASGDEVLRSDDGGAHATTVLTTDARIAGFALAGDDVAASPTSTASPAPSIVQSTRTLH